MTRSLFALTALVLLGCPSEAPAPTAPAPGSDSPALVKVAIQCNWLPEPQFGGIYHAAQAGIFAKHGIERYPEEGWLSLSASRISSSDSL